MVRVTDELALSVEHVTLYYASDPLLGHLPVLVFHGPSTTANYTLNRSRVQVHVYSPAGFQSYPRLTISPNQPTYSVVSHLPREFQGDEVCRGLAFGLYKYFQELPDTVKNHVKGLYPTRGRRPGSTPTLFGEQHAADLAKAMVQAENTADVIQILDAALQTQHVSSVDLDVVLPPGSIVPLAIEDLEEVPEDEDDILDPTLRQYGMYTPVVKLFGEPVFIPTSRLRRAPSRPTSLHNRGRLFTKDQKVELRLKMGELVDTEERYVLKLNELVRHVADDFRQAAKERGEGSTSPSEADLEKLFPPSADRILQMNTTFMEELRRVMDETEDSALKDMELPFPAPRLGGSKMVKDPSGALAMARLFVEWFPQFTDCYQDYIRASQHFPQLLNQFLDQQSSFRQRVVQKGEQSVRSILIEPVQRLPRYSLLIDQIVACLPITHRALQLMLRARDIITNICSMDDPTPGTPHLTNRLRNMVECWPADLEPQGRLVLAADVMELAAPYLPGPDDQDRTGLLLLFSDSIAILKKKKSSGFTGRDFLRELDKPSPAGLLASMTNAAGGPGSWEFAFTGWHALADVRFTESVDGRLVWMTSTQELKGAHSGEYFTSKAITSRCFSLQEGYEGRAARFGEDVVKARIEGRFCEEERESPTWTMRAVRQQDSSLGLYAAVFQEAAEELVEGRREPAAIRVVFDNDRGTKSAPVGHYGVEVVVEVRSGDVRRLQMNTLGLNGKRYSDDVAVEDFLPTLTRRVIQLRSSQFSVANQHLAPALVSYYTKVLRGLHISCKTEKARSFLNSSPVKMLSSFLGGSTNTSSGADVLGTPPGRQTRTPLGNLLSPGLPRSNSQKEFNRMAPSPNQGHEERPENPLVRLEQTFTGYVASLQTRKGYFIGRLLLSRGAADELAVNDLYNRLIESPFDLDASAELGTEVVFAAFEKFVRIAWREQMGPVITREALDALQVRASKRVPGEFADFVKFLFRDMAPQNLRAFTAIIKLLADLLDGCGNDGDRGALTVAFSEMLVDDGTAHNYINLLDRLVEDCDRVFDDGGFAASLQFQCSVNDSANSIGRSHKSASGSMTSNTSSLRRKFGFDTLLRQNSKSEAPNERTSMWRGFSKSSRNPAIGERDPSPQKSASARLGRSQSIDYSVNHPPPNPGKLRRPASRDRPPIAGAFDDISHRPGGGQQLETIGEPGDEPVDTIKRKRRSSLSDLKTLMAAASIEDSVKQALLPLRINKQTSEKFNSAPKVPSPSKIPASPPSRSLLSPAVVGQVVQQKENEGRMFEPKARGPELEAWREPDKVRSPIRPAFVRTHGKTLSSSQIPMLRPLRLNTSLSPERPSTSSGKLPPTPGRPTSPGKPPVGPGFGKLRLQSPQRLRERLQVEKQVIEDVDSALQSELSRISEDMIRINASLPRTPTSDIRRLSACLKAIEERVTQEMDELQCRQAEVRADLEASLRAGEQKIASVSQLYGEARAENELLYERFNTELAKIVKALKGKGMEAKEELVGKVKEANEEVARVRKENARLKREMVSLRALLKKEGDEGR